jgi:inward rectifier potassium channel
MGSTRIFGLSGRGVVVVGMRRRSARDLYHWLVTGSWSRVLVLYALAYFGTQALFGIFQLLVVSRVPDVQVDLGSLSAGPHGDAAPSARALASGMIEAFEGFVRWVELVIGAGIVFAKFARVRGAVLFSDVAVVGAHDGGPALMFRMANERTSQIVDAKVSVMLVRNELVDGEFVRRAHDLALVRQDSALFSHAWTAIHAIARGSPMLGESAATFAEGDAEIIVNISGFDEGLEKTMHARHVYPASRIRWNARFREIVRLRSDGKHVIDYRRFHDTAPLQADGARERTPVRKAR